MRTYGLLSEGGDCLYLFETLGDLTEVTLGERLLDAEEALVRIDQYAILAKGPGIDVPPKPS